MKLGRMLKQQLIIEWKSKKFGKQKLYLISELISDFLI